MAERGGAHAAAEIRDLVVSSDLSFEDAGEHELKGVPDRWHLPTE